VKKFCIIVDTSSNIKPNEFEDVFVVPMLLTKSEKNIVKTFHDQTDIDTNEMLKEMVDGEVYKTASPVMGECLSILEKAVKQYENVFIFSMPKILSGTFNQ
jgi:fatty acid-binding protein DegV